MYVDLDEWQRYHGPCSWFVHQKLLEWGFIVPDITMDDVIPYLKNPRTEEEGWKMRHEGMKQYLRHFTKIASGSRLKRGDLLVFGWDDDNGRRFLAHMGIATGRSRGRFLHWGMDSGVRIRHFGAKQRVNLVGIWRATRRSDARGTRLIRWGE